MPEATTATTATATLPGHLHQGTCDRYFTVPGTFFEDLLSVASEERPYFNREIRDAFRTQRVP